MNLFLNCCVIFFCFQNFALADSKENDASTKKVNISNPMNEPVIFSFDNFLGKDTSIKASGRLTEKDKYIKAGVEKKHIFDSPYFIGMDAKGQLWHDTEFNLSDAGWDLYLGRNITKFTKLSAMYRVDRYDVSGTDETSAVDFRRSDGNNTVAALSLKLKRSTADDEFYPTKGTRCELIAEYALRSLGGDFNFSKYAANAGYFYTPFWNITLVGHINVGWMENFGNSADVPFFERYFVGSSSTVRGFEWGKAGPISPNGSPLGADVMAVGNLEARVPIYKKLKGTVFFDTGRVFNKIKEFGHVDLRESAGFGLRYLTPWVVLRADYGFILDRRSGENRGRLHLTLGMPF